MLLCCFTNESLSLFFSTEPGSMRLSYSTKYGSTRTVEQYKEKNVNRNSIVLQELHGWESILYDFFQMLCTQIIVCCCDICLCTPLCRIAQTKQKGTIKLTAIVQYKPLELMWWHARKGAQAHSSFKQDCCLGKLIFCDDERNGGKGTAKNNWFTF